MTDISEVVNQDHPHYGLLESRGVKTVGDLVDQFAADRKFISDSHRVPPDTAPPEEWEKFYRRLGAPESADGYSVPENGDQTLSQILSDLRPTAREHGIPKKAWDALVSRAANTTTTARRKAEDEANERIREWESQVRQQFPEAAEEKIALVRRTSDQLAGGDPALKATLDATILKVPKFLDMLLQASTVASADTTPGNAVEGNQVTEQQNKEELIELAMEGQALAQDPALKDQRHREHRQKMHRYYSIQKKLQDQGYEGVLDERLQPNYLT